MRFLGFSALASGVLLAGQAYAIDYIQSPNVEKGELELEYSGSRTFDKDKSKDSEQSHEFEAKYGLTDRVAIELEGEYEKEPDSSLRFTKVEVGGRYQFFEQGAAWVDTGLLLAYGQETKAREANTIEAKLLLEKQTGKFLHRANIGLEQEVGHYASGGPERSLQWSTRYRYSRGFEPGFEIQSDFGKGSETNRFSDQEHYVGPAIYGRLLPGLHYEAAYYMGVSDAAARNALRVHLEYEIHF